MAGSTNRFIVDASYVLSFLLPDENIKEVEETFYKLSTGEFRISAPQLLPFEVLNSLKVAVLRKRVTLQAAQELAQYFFNLGIVTLSIDYLKTLDLAQAEKITFYDASYLYLAQSQNLPLLTLDKHLENLAL